MYTGIRTQLEAGCALFCKAVLQRTQPGSLSKNSLSLLCSSLLLIGQLLLKALWPGEENPVQNFRMDAHNGATKTTGRMGYGCELRLNAKVTGTAKGSANSNDANNDANMVKEKPFRSGHEFPAISAIQSSR